MEMKILMMSLRALRLPLCYKKKKTKLSRIFEVEWHQVNSGVDKTFLGKGELNKNTPKGNFISRFIWENHQKHRRERWGIGETGSSNQASGHRKIFHDSLAIASISENHPIPSAVSGVGCAALPAASLPPSSPAPCNEHQRLH